MYQGHRPRRRLDLTYIPLGQPFQPSASLELDGMYQAGNQLPTIIVNGPPTERFDRGTQVASRDASDRRIPIRPPDGATRNLYGESRHYMSHFTHQPLFTRPYGWDSMTQMSLGAFQSPGHQPFWDGVPNNFDQYASATLHDRSAMQGRHHAPVSNPSTRRLDSVHGVPPRVATNEPFRPMLQQPTPPPSSSRHPAMNIPQSTAIPMPVQHKIRICSGLNCAAVFPANYPHLRCRSCRANNVPRRPEYKGIMTGAQMAYQTHRPPPSQGPPFTTSSIPPPASYNDLFPPVPRDVLSRSIPPALPPPAVKIEPGSSPVPVASIDALLAQTSADGKAEEDAEMEELDLSYPDADTRPSTPAGPKKSLIDPDSTPKATKSITSADATSEPEFPIPNSKRRKVSHPQAATPTLRPVHPNVPLFSSRTPTQHASQSNICSTPNCTNAVSNPHSLGSGRCSACILRDWKSKKSRKAGESSQKRGKTVSWADSISTAGQPINLVSVSGVKVETVENEVVVGVESAGGSAKPALERATPPTPSLKIKLKLSQPRPLVQPVSAVGTWDSELSDLTGSGSASEGESEPESSSSEEDIPLAAQRRTGLKIRIPSGMHSSGSSTPTSVASASGSPAPGPSTNTTSRGLTAKSHWMASLDPEAAQIIANGGRRCVNFSRCKQVFRKEYHWKSCVLCRARTRQYQRKRQNLQSKHGGLDEELANFKPLGAAGSTARLLPTPSLSPSPGTTNDSNARARDEGDRIQAEDRRLGGVTHALLPGARLCSVKQCPQILPSVEEYGRKMCMRCRTRCKETRVRKENEMAGVVVQEVPFDPQEFLARLQNTDKRPDSRCRSIDCGMLVAPNVLFGYCHQCRLRALRALKRNLRKEGKSEADIAVFVKKVNALDAAHQVSGTSLPSSACPSANTGLATSENGMGRGPSSTTPQKLSIRIPSLKPGAAPIHPPAPYPEYKCLESLLENFSRLSKDFFDAQVRHQAYKGLSDALEAQKVEIMNGSVESVIDEGHQNGAPVGGNEDAKVKKEDEEAREEIVRVKEEPDGGSENLGEPSPSESPEGTGIRQKASPRPHSTGQMNSSKPTSDDPSGSEPSPTSPTDGADSVSLFCFDGEFTMAAPNFDVVSRKPSIDAMVMRVKEEAQRSAKVLLGPKRWVSLFDYGISTRFLCARECRLIGPPKVQGGAPEETVKLMQGELEVAVVIDRSHKLIPGQRTVVRMRLIG